MKKLISLFVVTLTIAACSKSPTQPSTLPVPEPTPSSSTSFVVSGTVLSAGQEGDPPIEGAQVSVGDDAGAFTSTTTDSEGRFSLPDLPAATWQLSISKDGYQATSMMIEVTADMAVEVQLSPLPN